MRPVAASSEGKPSEASSIWMSRVSSSKKRITLAGLPRNLARKSGLCVAMPGRTGVEVTLSRHVAAQRHQHRRAKGKFVGAQEGGDQHIAAGPQTAIAAQAHAPPQTVLHQHLLRFR